nr:DUF3570 domain-containing protein [Shewanella woodyi]
MQLTAMRKKRSSIQESSTQKSSTQRSSAFELASGASDKHQCKRYRNINKSLTIASFALFSAPVMATEIDDSKDMEEADKTSISLPTIASEKKLEVTKIETALLYYQEPDRVTAAEGIFNLQASYGDKSELEGKLLLDTLTGASPNGAAPQQQQQTFTRPSGNGVYYAKNGETPLDDTFKDTRLQLNGNWTETLSNTDKVNLGFHLSREYDYTSLGVNSGAERSFNRGNSAVNLAFGYYYDIIDPVGGRPVSWAPMLFRDDFSSQSEFKQAFDKTRDLSSSIKQTFDLSVGFTQLLNRYWLVQGNYSFSYLDGYMTDPYKIISQIDERGTAQGYLYENRPDTRYKQSVFLLTKGALETGVVDLSYRYSADDWGIDSHTVETHYRYQFTASLYGQIHLRYYRQSAVDFYHAFLPELDELPEYGSADSRLGKLTAYTFGIKFGHKLQGGTKFSYRLELYQHRPQDNGDERVGQLAHLGLYEQVNAVIAQIGFAF